MTLYRPFSLTLLALAATLGVPMLAPAGGQSAKKLPRKAKAASPASAAAPRWERMPLRSPEDAKAGVTPGGEGAQVPRALVISRADPNFLLLGIDVGGLYRSLDGGKLWEQASVGWNARGANAFAIDPRNPRRALGAGGNSMDWGQTWGPTPNGVYLSIDKAASWRHVLGALDGPGGALAYEPGSFDAAKGYCTVAYYTANLQALYRTDDGGATWAKVGPSPLAPNPDRGVPARLQTHPTRRSVVYVGGRDGFFRSEDGGKTFAKTHNGEVHGLDVTNSAPDNVYISGSEGVLISRDAGRTFAPLASAGLDRQNGKPVLNVKVSPADPKRMTCWIAGDHWKSVYFASHDAGATWQTWKYDNRLEPLPYNVREGLIAWHPTDPDVVFGLGGDWVTKSTDGARTFRWSNNGYNGVMLGGLFNFSAHTPKTVFLAFQDYNGAFTTDGGATWNYRDVSGKGWGGFCYGGHAVDDQVMWCGDAESWGSPRQLRISRDGGKTWTTPKGADGKPLVWAGSDVSFSDPTDASVLFASNFRSTDKGETWAAMPDCDSVYTDDAVSHALYGRKGDTVVRSTDKGATWTKVADVAGGVSDLAFDGQKGRLYAASQDKLKAFAGGQWTTLDTPPDQYGSMRVTTVAVDPRAPSVLYVGGPKNVYASHTTVCRSTDSGATWTNLTPNKPLTGPNASGPHEVAAIRVDPVTRWAWVNGQCYGMWRIAPPGPNEKGVAAAFAAAPKAPTTPATVTQTP